LEEMMRALRFLNLGILAALIASSAILYAQDEKQQEDKSRQEEPKRQDQAKPGSRPNEANRPAQNEAKPARPEQQEQRQQEAQPRGEMRPTQQEPNRQETARPETGRRESGQQETARPEDRRQESGRQEAGRPQDEGRDAHRGERIPEDRFRAQFGREHHFEMRRPEVVEGRPRFQYGGYTFVLVDPWPPEWTYSDDCYIDDIDGEYFLFNSRHPEERLALELVM
jgi:hypothetical protein